MASFSFLGNIEKIQENFSNDLNTFEKIMEDEAFAPKEQMLHFPLYFQSRQTALSWSKGLYLNIVYTIFSYVYVISKQAVKLI